MVAVLDGKQREQNLDIRSGMLIRLLLTAGLTCGFALAQRSDTIWQQLSNTSGSPTSFTSAPVNNIGQTGHTIYIKVAGFSCSPTLLGGGLYYSWDNVTYAPFGNQLSTTPGVATTTVLEATGAFPYVRAQFTYQSGCTTTVFYTGVVQSPFPYIQGTLPLNSPTNLLQTTTQNFVPQPVVNGFIMANRDGGVTTSNGIIAADIQGGVTNNVSVPLGTTVLATAGTTGNQNRVYVSSLVLSTTVLGTVSVTEGVGATCGSNIITLGSFSLNPGVPLVVPKFRTQVIADNLCITAPGTSDVHGSITYGILASQLTGDGQ